MPNEPAYLAGNAKSLDNLRALLQRLSDADLKADLGEGWTVSAMLGHLAFYDFRIAALAAHWRQSGAVTPSALDADILNVALLPVWLAVPPRHAIELALEAAEAPMPRSPAWMPPRCLGLKKLAGPSNWIAPSTARSISNRLSERWPPNPDDYAGAVGSTPT